MPTPQNDDILGLNSGPGSIIERRKLRLEYRKLRLERQKIELEHKKLSVSLYVEDFKARWQELLNFENENNRWITLYVTALLLVISWVLNNSDKYAGISGLYGKGDNAYFILSIAIINALYTFSMAIKGYQIQQIALYQYKFIARSVRALTNVEFNDWERFRRAEFGTNIGPEWIRSVYYVFIGTLPLVVSSVIIVLYIVTCWSDQAKVHQHISVRNWFAIVAGLVVASCAYFSLRTSKLNEKWTNLLEGDKKGPPKQDTVLRVPESSNSDDQHG